MTRYDLALPDPAERPAVTVAEAAGYLGVGRHSAYAMTRSGELPSFTIGRRIMVPTVEVLRMLGRSTGTAAADPVLEIAAMVSELDGVQLGRLRRLLDG